MEHSFFCSKWHSQRCSQGKTPSGPWSSTSSPFCPFSSFPCICICFSLSTLLSCTYYPYVPSFILPFDLNLKKGPYLILYHHYLISCSTSPLTCLNPFRALRQVQQVLLTPQQMQTMRKRWSPMMLRMMRMEKPEIFHPPPFLFLSTSSSCFSFNRASRTNLSPLGSMSLGERDIVLFIHYWRPAKRLL